MQSALRACHTRGEVVVVADHDPTAEKTLSCLATDPRLRLVHNDGAPGASAARNCGVASSRGEVVFFLDDDDEIISDYPVRVMDVVQAGLASWGFSRHLTDTGGGIPPEPASRKGRSRGIIKTSEPFKRNIAATSNGFWVRRDLCLAVGGFCLDQKLDEDTDLCCRLVAASHRPWFEEESGMILNRDTSIERLTSQSTARLRGECYLRTLQRSATALRKYPGAISFLAFRAQYMLLRAGMTDALHFVDREVPWLWLRVALKARRILDRTSA